MLSSTLTSATAILYFNDTVNNFLDTKLRKWWQRLIPGKLNKEKKTKIPFANNTAISIDLDTNLQSNLNILSDKLQPINTRKDKTKSMITSIYKII